VAGEDVGLNRESLPALGHDARVGEVVQQAPKMDLDPRQIHESRDDSVLVEIDVGQRGDDGQQLPDVVLGRFVNALDDRRDQRASVLSQYLGLSQLIERSAVDCDSMGQEGDQRVALRDLDGPIDGAAIGQMRLGVADDLADGVRLQRMQLKDGFLNQRSQGAAVDGVEEMPAEPGSGDEQEVRRSAALMQKPDELSQISAAVRVVDDQYEVISS
jgi:hypothetical protein